MLVVLDISGEKFEVDSRILVGRASVFVSQQAWWCSVGQLCIIISIIFPTICSRTVDDRREMLHSVLLD